MPSCHSHAGVGKELPKDLHVSSCALSGQQLTEEKGPIDTQPCGYPGMQDSHTTHLRARLGLSGRMAVKSLQESDLCDRHPSRVLMPLFLQRIGRQKEGGYHDHDCQLSKGHLDLLPSPSQVAP